VYVSAFEVFRIGPGPSATYTLGPQRAALRFVHDLEADGVMASVHRVEAELYGGLAFHGREHATPQALVAGLAGLLPERCDGESLVACKARVQADATVQLNGRHRVRFDPSRDIRAVIDRSLAYDGNAVRFVARDLRGDVVAASLYFSVGGGVVIAEHETGVSTWAPRVPYPYGSAQSLLDICRAHGKRICDLVRANECSLWSPAEVRAGLLLFAQTMRASVERGLTAEGRLPGGRHRTASAWNDASRDAAAMPAQLCAVYATAVGEENAVGGRVVAAPSAGAAGPVAALMQLWRDSEAVAHEERAMDFLLAGAAVGGIMRRAGARHVGCQGEIGMGAAMAAAGFAAVHNASNAQILYAAERALEPHLGLECDLADARIEDPCIERGALAATRAHEAATTALRVPQPQVNLDAVVRLVVESGRVMAGRHKSATIGGLAVNVIEC
jgi:L-serine dehydratase